MVVLALLFCLQACIFQMVYTQCLGGYPNALNGFPSAYGPVAAPFGPLPLEGPGLATLAGSYGGAGEGDVIVNGEMPVAGTTLVAGQVPIVGTVRFSGAIPAAGTIAVSGSCACGANFDAPFVY